MARRRAAARRWPAGRDRSQERRTLRSQRTRLARSRERNVPARARRHDDVMEIELVDAARPTQRKEPSSTGRRRFLASVTGLAAITAMAPAAFARNFIDKYDPDGPIARYPEPTSSCSTSVSSTSSATPRSCASTRGTLWAEGRPGTGSGRYLSGATSPTTSSSAGSRKTATSAVVPLSGRQLQRQHLRLSGPADRLRARHPPRRPLRATTARHRPGRRSSRASRSTRRTTAPCTPTAASGSPIPATAA